MAPKSAPPTTSTQERVRDAMRVLAMLVPGTPYQPIVVNAAIAAISGVLIRRGLATAAELEEAEYQGQLNQLDQLIAQARAARPGPKLIVPGQQEPEV